MVVALFDLGIDALGLDRGLRAGHGAILNGHFARDIIEPALDLADDQMGNGKPNAGVRGIKLVGVGG